MDWSVVRQLNTSSYSDRRESYEGRMTSPRRARDACINESKTILFKAPSALNENDRFQGRTLRRSSCTWRHLTIHRSMMYESVLTGRVFQFNFHPCSNRLLLLQRSTFFDICWSIPSHAAQLSTDPLRRRGAPAEICYHHNSHVGHN